MRRSKEKWLVLALITVFAASHLFPSEVVADNKKPIEAGWIERVKIRPGNIVLHAKLDTGADHCSLHAKNISIYMKRQKKRVRFLLRNRGGEEAQLDLPVERMAKIKRKKGKSQERPVVRMFVCLGESFMKVDVNLTDRSNFAYPMLVGRSFLSGLAMVNPAKSFHTEPTCNIPEGRS